MLVPTWVLLLLFALQGRGTAPSTTRTQITGSVIRADAAAGNQQLPNTRVELRPTGAFANTDSNGNFTFRDVQPGRYTLVPHREGFIIQESPTKNINPIGMTITVLAGQNLTNLALPMMPAPTISGYAYHPNGEPLAAGVVEAYARRYTPYGRQLRIVKKTLTNDFGEYRLHWLNFGEYVVTVNYSDRAQRSSLQGIQLSPNVTKPDDGYPMTFYERGTIPAEGKPVRLAPATDSSNVNIFVSDAPRFTISGRIVSAYGLPADLNLTFVAEGSDLNAERDYSVSVGGGGAFTITGVSPGGYALLASSSQMASDVVNVSVANSDLSNVAVPLYPALTLHGHVSMEGQPRTNPAGLRVSVLRTRSDIDQRFDAITSADGSFTVPGIGRGEFDVLVDGMSPNTYARSIRYFGQAGDVLFTPLRVATLDADSTLDITLSTAAATVDGLVADASAKPVPGAQIVLIPEVRLRRRSDRYIVGYADASGSFQLRSVPPGTYTAFAFEEIEPGAYFAFAYDQRVNSLFGSRGAPVTVSESGTTTLQLKVIPASETAGGFQ